MLGSAGSQTEVKHSVEWVNIRQVMPYTTTRTCLFFFFYVVEIKDLNFEVSFDQVRKTGMCVKTVLEENIPSREGE